MNNDPTILLTIDVEDWFQVENFKQYIPFSSWPDRELRVERNTYKLLDLFDSVSLQPSAIRSQSKSESATSATVLERSSPQAYPVKSNSCLTGVQQSSNSNEVRCTFFVLGWIAERLPHLVREIYNRDHEVASHGYLHNLCTGSTIDGLKKDLTDSKHLLEDLIGDNVYGYRAPSFSINDDILKIIEDSGYLYDSSYNSFVFHGRYGKLNLNGNQTKGIAHKISEAFYELPISNLEFRTQNSKFKTLDLIIPWGGGGYFRLIPFTIFRRGVCSIIKNDGAYMFYLHPWEIDPAQPWVEEAPRHFKFRHYSNLKSCQKKLTKMIDAFSFCDFMKCHQYIK